MAACGRSSAAGVGNARAWRYQAGARGAEGHPEMTFIRRIATADLSSHGGGECAIEVLKHRIGENFTAPIFARNRHGLKPGGTLSALHTVSRLSQEPVMADAGNDGRSLHGVVGIRGTSSSGREKRESLLEEVDSQVEEFAAWTGSAAGKSMVMCEESADLWQDL